MSRQSAAAATTRRGRLALALCLLSFLAAIGAAPAAAVVPARPLLEPFGPLAQPQFTEPGPMAFDAANDDLLTVDRRGQNETQRIAIEAGGALGGTYRLSFGGQSTGWQGEATLSGGEAGSGDLVGAEGSGEASLLAQGHGNLTSGSTEITGLTVSAGAFAVGESIEADAGLAEAIPSGTTIASCSPSCSSPTALTISQAATATRNSEYLMSGSKIVHNVATETGAFAVGQRVESFIHEKGAIVPSPIVPPGTTITAVDESAHTLTLSQPVASQWPDLVLRAGSLQVTNVSGGPFSAGRAISGQGIQEGTTIAALGAGTLTLSKVPTATATGVALVAGSLQATAMHTTSGALAKGEQLSGTGIQPGTIVTEVKAGSFTLSLPPTTSGASAGLRADLPAHGSRGSTPEETTIKEALEKLSTIGTGNVGREPTPEVWARTPTSLVFYLQFQGALAERPLPLLGCDGSGLTGTSPTCTVAELAKNRLDTGAGHRPGIFRNHVAGTPSPFAALGTDVLDGQRGYGGRPCAEEADSCDETPQGFLGFLGGQEVLSIAIDESAGPTAGNIYVPQSENHLIDIFAADGRYLGQITKYRVGSEEKQLGEPRAVAVDGDGALYVADRSRNRIHKYESQGAAHAPLTNADNVANFTFTEPRVLAAGAGPTAGYIFAAGAPLEGNPRLQKIDSTSGSVAYTMAAGCCEKVAVNPADGRVFAVPLNGNFVDEYDASGPSTSLLSRATLPTPSGGITGPQGIAVNPASDDLYVANLPYLSHELSTFGPSLRPAVVTVAPSGLGETAATLNGTVNPEGIALESCSFEWGLAGSEAFEHTQPCAESLAEIGAGNKPVAVHLDLTGLSRGARYHYRLAAANEFGQATGEAQEFVTPRPPAIEEESVQHVTDSEAILRARVNPEGFATTYRLQYGPSEAYGQETEVRTLGPVDLSFHQVGFVLEGLAPGTTYHWRLTADNTDPSAPGTGTEAGEDRTFTTFTALVPETGCANQPYRAGAAAALPDCRGYEMVSPLDKEGGDIVVHGEVGTALPATLDQSSVSGSRFVYGSYRAFGDAPSAPLTSQYLAARTERGQPGEGWASHAILAPRERLTVDTLSSLYSELHLLSPDLCQAWFRSSADPPLAPAAIAGDEDLYRRTDDECGGPSYEAISTVAPTDQFLAMELVGVGADGAAAYQVRGNLPGTGAPPAPSGRLGLYWRAGGEGSPTRFVCVLPGGEAWSDSCTAGMGALANGQSRQTTDFRALSADGRRLYWTAAESGKGKIYLRENPGEEQSSIGAGHCSEHQKACTIAVSGSGEEQSGTSGSQFWTAAADGSKALYQTGSDLYEFDLATETSSLIAHKFLGLMGASEDASYLYFVSEEALTEANLQGHAPLAGKRNLYLSHGGELRFLTTLTSGVGGIFYGDAFFDTDSARPDKRTSRVAPDGRHAVFISTAGPISQATQGVPSPTGYDNTDVHSGRPDAEVYIYDATAAGGAGRLICASCNPSGARPAGAPVEEGVGSELSQEHKFWAAARLPVWQSTLYPGHLLADDGRRLFFDAGDALSPADSNGSEDVYEWEAPGAGGCHEGGAGYSAQNQGCLYLISSGTSAGDSTLLDASPSGDDVFFSTAESLVPQDYGLIDAYDARVGGGFPAPPAKSAQCEGEACQSPPEAPNDPTPGSSSFQGAGNLRPAQKAKKHRKHGKHRKKRHRHAAGHKRRAGR